MKRSNKTVALIILSFAITAIIDSYFLYAKGISSPTYLPHLLFIAIFGFVWCKQHAFENSVKDLGGHALACGLIGIIGVPIYGFSKFGLRAGGRIVLKMILCLALCIFLIVAIDLGIAQIYV